jgi:Fe-S cluster assembly ATP-binding protein
MSTSFLEVHNLSIVSDGKSIIDGLSLRVRPGEIHAIVGPNGAGKSTFVKAIAGCFAGETSGSIRLFGQEACALTPEARAHLGLFVSFQTPVEIPGLPNAQFLRSALNAQKKSRGEPLLSEKEFTEILDVLLQKLDINPEFVRRDVNVGFSGGEKKKNELLQMLLFAPKLALLDEIDSGMDTTSMQAAASHIREFMTPTSAVVVITHYQQFLTLLQPDWIHQFTCGRLLESKQQALAGVKQ